jgi:hypothetical protein
MQTLLNVSVPAAGAIGVLCKSPQWQELTLSQSPAVEVASGSPAPILRKPNARLPMHMTRSTKDSGSLLSRQCMWTSRPRIGRMLDEVQSSSFFSIPPSQDGRSEQSRQEKRQLCSNPKKSEAGDRLLSNENEPNVADLGILNSQLPYLGC